MTQTPQPFSPEYLAIWPQGLQDWIQEIAPNSEEITFLEIEAEVIDRGLDEHGWVQKAAGPHRMVTVVYRGMTYFQIFRRQEHGEWERV